MAVFRIEKNKNYTVMANYHLRDISLSLKAKGLLSLMLSLPEGWDYTTKGLACICKDGVDSICSTVKELENAGYVQRRRLRNELGHLTEIEYTILEKPVTQRLRRNPRCQTALPKQEEHLNGKSQFWIILFWTILNWLFQNRQSLNRRNLNRKIPPN